MGHMFIPATTSARQTVLLCCPACGDESVLRHAEDLPPGLARMITTCPACSDHGKDDCVLIFADGRVARDAPVVAHKPLRRVSARQSLEMGARG